jgi:hypothetical protein
MENNPLEYGTDAQPSKSGLFFRMAVIGVTVVACGFGCWWGVFAITEPQLGINVSRDEAPIRDLPAEAHRVSYRVGGAMDPAPITYEFSTSEASFRVWADANGWRLQEGSTSMVRFDSSRATINRGLFLHKSTGPDSGWHVAYDLDVGRAYYYAHSR